MPEHPQRDENGSPERTAIRSSEEWEGYSIGGGIIRTGGEKSPEAAESKYPHSSMTRILKYVGKNGLTLWEYVFMHEGKGIREFLGSVMDDMMASIETGLSEDGVLAGGLYLSRKASSYKKRAAMLAEPLSTSARLYSYALAVSETNAAGGNCCYRSHLRCQRRFACCSAFHERAL